MKTLICVTLLAATLAAPTEARAGDHDFVLLAGGGLAGVESLNACAASGAGCMGGAGGAGLLLGWGYTHTWGLLRVGARMESVLVFDRSTDGGTLWAVAHVGLLSRRFLADVGAGMGGWWLVEGRSSAGGPIWPLQVRAGVRMLPSLSVVGSFTLALGQDVLGGFIGGMLEWRPRG